MLDGKKIKELMEKHSMLQKDLAECVGVSEMMLSYIVRGVKNPSIEVAKRIADTLGVTIDELVKE